MKKIILKTTTISLITTNALAMELYRVQPGDTLSQIVRKHFPNEKIYGRNGKMREVLTHNPHLKNPNRIFPNQEILLDILTPLSNQQAQITPHENSFPLSEELEKEIVEENNEKSNINRQTSLDRNNEYWNLSFHFGPRYTTLTQENTLGRAEVTALFLNNFKLSSEFKLEDWTFGAHLETYRFKYEIPQSTKSKQLNSLEIETSYKWIIGTLRAEEVLLFKNDAGTVEMPKSTLLSANVGIRKKIELQTMRPTSLLLKGLVGFPISSSTNHSAVDISSTSGVSLRAQANLSRELVSKELYSLLISWETEVEHKSIDRKLEWEASNGEVKSKQTDLSSLLGITLQF